MKNWRLNLVVAKGGIDVGVASPVILPMVGTMTIITTFLSPYFVKYGWKFTERFVKGQDKNEGDQQQRLC